MCCVITNRRVIIFKIISLRQTYHKNSHTQAAQNARFAIIYGQEELLSFKSNPSYNEEKYKEKVKNTIKESNMTII